MVGARGLDDVVADAVVVVVLPVAVDSVAVWAVDPRVVDASGALTVLVVVVVTVGFLAIEPDAVCTSVEVGSAPGETWPQPARRIATSAATCAAAPNPTLRVALHRIAGLTLLRGFVGSKGWPTGSAVRLPAPARSCLPSRRLGSLDRNAVDLAAIAVVRPDALD